MSNRRFQFESQQVRTVMKDGEPWFVAADVCGVLDVSQPHHAVARLDDDEKGSDIITTPGGQQLVNVINESGLYSLILTSRKPEAKRFKKWVTGEVLPTIRKTGSYGDPMAALKASAKPKD
ncbi:Bro-N domain-containing protein [Geomonas sp. Red32]|nr:Bro-N domain-containing protein [Geomonas sp. Red32]MCM0083947.1 Bro-N domain-containing protein [Geomonas sp. Red32]